MLPNTTLPALVVAIGFRATGGEGVSFIGFGLSVARGDLRLVFKGRLAGGSLCISEFRSLAGAVGGSLPIGVE